MIYRCTPKAPNLLDHWQAGLFLFGQLGRLCCDGQGVIISLLGR